MIPTPRATTSTATGQPVLPSTTVVTTTWRPPSSATTAPPPNDLGTVDGIIATLEADPERYGPATGDVVDALDKIRGNGRTAENRAADLLDQAAEWVATGELDASVLAMLEPVLGPIAGNGDDEDEGDD